MHHVCVCTRRGELIASCVCVYQEGGAKQVKQLFPFTKFFDNAPQPLFHGESYAQDMDIADGCFRHIRKIFTQLEVPATLTPMFTVVTLTPTCIIATLTPMFTVAILTFMYVVATLTSMFNVGILTFMFIVATFTTMGSQ